MKCKVRNYHLELEKVEYFPLKDNIQWSSNAIFRKVDDYESRTVNVYWDETMYVSSDLKERVLDDLQDALTNTVLLYTEENLGIIEKKVNLLLLNLYHTGNLSTRPGDGTQLVLPKDDMYEHY